MSERRIDWIAKHAVNQPDKPCLIDIAGDNRLTYRQVDDRVNRLAQHLVDAGVKKGDRVAALTLIGSEIIELQYAAWRIGAIFVPVNNRLARDELAYILNDSTPALVLADCRFKELVAQVEADVTIGRWLFFGDSAGDSGYAQILAETPPLDEAIDLGMDDAAHIIYSSGTTGRPKGVVHSHRTLFYALLCRIIPGAVDRQTVTLCNMPLFHITGLNGMVNATLMAGGTAVLIAKFDSTQMLELIDDAALGISYIFAVPTMLDELRRHSRMPETDFSRIRTCFTGTASVPRDLIQWWARRNVPICQAYGMTETAIGVSLATVEDNLRNPATIGKPVLFADFRVVRADGSPAEVDEVGELLIRSLTTMVAYWNNPGATGETYANGWLKTGDLASRDSEGYYYIKGRRKDMYISGGENVYPAEVEEVLRHIPEIHQVAVVGVPHEKWGETGCAVVVPEPGSCPTLEQIEAFCETRLAKYKWPKHLVLVAALPLNSTGKVNKLLLKEQLPGGWADSTNSKNS